MTYVPPTGWIESRVTQVDEPIVSTFHRHQDCTRVQDKTRLKPSDKPYSARRCPLCAA